MGVRVTQESLFEQEDIRKPNADVAVTMRLLVTVKAAPNPSAAYGETVCLAGIRMDVESPGWVRLYPVNFRELDAGVKFSKYSIVSVRVRPARSDPRAESWRPEIPSLRVEQSLPPWKARRAIVDPHVRYSMCDVLHEVIDSPPASSLALVRPKRVMGVELARHPGWTKAEQAKIDAYVAQPDLMGSRRTALQAPRLRGWYRYRCHARSCTSHRQGILDWEWVALQRRLGHLTDTRLADELRCKFFGEMCAANRDVAFFVGNQAKRQNTFSVLGVYYPTK